MLVQNLILREPKAFFNLISMVIISYKLRICTRAQKITGWALNWKSVKVENCDLVAAKTCIFPRNII